MVGEGVVADKTVLGLILEGAVGVEILKRPVVRSGIDDKLKVVGGIRIRRHIPQPDRIDRQRVPGADLVVGVRGIRRLVHEVEPDCRRRRDL